MVANVVGDFMELLSSEEVDDMLVAIADTEGLNALADLARE